MRNWQEKKRKVFSEKERQAPKNQCKLSLAKPFADTENLEFYRPKDFAVNVIERNLSDSLVIGINQGTGLSVSAFGN